MVQYHAHAPGPMMQCNIPGNIPYSVLLQKLITNLQSNNFLKHKLYIVQLALAHYYMWV